MLAPVGLYKHSRFFCRLLGSRGNVLDAPRRPGNQTMRGDRAVPCGATIRVRLGFISPVSLRRICFVYFEMGTVVSASWYLMLEGDHVWESTR